VWLNPPRGEYQMKLELVGIREGEPPLATTLPQKLVLGGAAL
jgi:hypothetical protein